jgi:membrane protein DedA with SNARE-associated domain
MFALAVALIAATFVSEDAACVAAGALIAGGRLPAPAAIGACAFGIFAGDMMLWALGRAGAGVLARKCFARRLPLARIEEARLWLDRNSGRTILMSRFTPGARLPVYVAAGVLRIPPLRFAAWTLCAAALWTPIVVLAAASAAGTAGRLPPSVLVSIAAAALIVMPAGRRAAALAVPAVRQRMSRLAARGETGHGLAGRAWFQHRLLARWEFWPGWLFYAPVAAWVLILALRHRSLTVLTACNPGIADGGFVGESKFAILQMLPGDAAIPAVRLSPQSSSRDLHSALAAMRQRRWCFPVVVKPDVGQRGAGVRLIGDAARLDDYLAHSAGDVLLQRYHPGPGEAGIFYYRFPGERHGRIFSITDKQFPVVVGDGRSTLAQLVVAHPRYRLQAALFLRRHREQRDRILPEGERFQLAFAGNHAQGTTFRDGRHLLTPALERRIDDISRQIPGFFIGRFDVRYSNVERFMAGEDLAIVELNGATAESTNIYDPETPLIDAYRTLFRQWSLVFAIGAANRRRGVAGTTARRLFQLMLAHLNSGPLALSD